jgi:hypothetical protein
MQQTVECEGRYNTNGKGGEIGSQMFMYMIEYGFISHQKILQVVQIKKKMCKDNPKQEKFAHESIL